MLPVIALVGRPNVGKSTLFNTLTRSREALVHDRPGITRDRLYGRVRRHGTLRALVVDTGGLGDDPVFGEHVDRQVERVIREADEILLVVDYRDGVNPRDEEIGHLLRKSGKSVCVAVNKAEGIAAELACAEFQCLGLGAPWPISAKRGDRVEILLDELLRRHPAARDDADRNNDAVRVAVVGRPNAGKSTLVNALVGEERMIVLDEPGTTRDSVSVPLARGDREFVIVDTAGMRKRKAVVETVEQFSVVQAVRAIEKANVCLLVLDAWRGSSDQDAAIAGMIDDRGRSIMLVANKWDRLNHNQKQSFTSDTQRRFSFLPRHETLTVSALHGTGVGGVLAAAARACRSAMIELATSDLNRRLETALASRAPPLHAGHAVRIKFAHQVGRNPPLVAVHGNRLEHVPPTYTRYLTNFLQKSYGLWGTRVRIQYRRAENPYAVKRPRARRASS